MYVDRAVDAIHAAQTAVGVLINAHSGGPGDSDVSYADDEAELAFGDGVGFGMEALGIDDPYRYANGAKCVDDRRVRDRVGVELRDREHGHRHGAGRHAARIGLPADHGAVRRGASGDRARDLLVRPVLRVRPQPRDRNDVCSTPPGAYSAQYASLLAGLAGK